MRKHAHPFRHLLRVIWICAAIAAGALLAYSGFRASHACYETRYPCAPSQEKDGFWSGRLVDANGRPLKQHLFEVAFGSRVGLPRVPFRTDARGRYCIVWAFDGGTLQTHAGTFLLSDGDLPDLYKWTPFTMARRPLGCESAAAGIPWTHARTITRSWQFLLLVGLPLLTLLAAFWAGASSWPNQRPRVAVALRLGICGSLLVTSVAATVVLWSTS